MSFFYFKGSGETNDDHVDASGDDDLDQTVDDELDTDPGSGSSTVQFGKCLFSKLD